MKIDFTEDMLNAKLGVVVYKIDYKLHKSLKVSDWKRFRVVKVKMSECSYSYKIEETSIRDKSTVLPRFLGGMAGIYGEIGWRTFAGFSCDVKFYDNYKNAVARISAEIVIQRKREEKFARENGGRDEEIVEWFGGVNDDGVCGLFKERY